MDAVPQSREKRPRQGQRPQRRSRRRRHKRHNPTRQAVEPQISSWPEIHDPTFESEASLNAILSLRKSKGARSRGLNQSTVGWAAVRPASAIDASPIQRFVAARPQTSPAGDRRKKKQLMMQETAIRADPMFWEQRDLRNRFDSAAIERQISVTTHPIQTPVSIESITGCGSRLYRAVKFAQYA